MDGLVHGRRRQLRKEREARATRRRDLDQKHRDSTQLRKQRIDKLKALENDQGPLLLAPDGAAKEGDSTLEAETTDSFRHCYTCKKRFDGLHEFYSQLCPSCAALNWRMRSRTEDLTGRVALLTGARVKIGFETGLKLLRAGAYLIATTRFPHDLAARYGMLAAFFRVFFIPPIARVRAGREADADEWRGRLEVHGLDLRDLRGVETFCAFIAERHEALDVLVNNARPCGARPARAFAPTLVEGPLDGHGGRSWWSTMPSPSSCVEIKFWAHCSGRRHRATPIHGALLEGERRTPRRTARILHNIAVVSRDDASKALAVVAPEDETVSFVAGKTDVNGQQLDLREHNSWTATLDEVATAEVVEAQAINCVAPFILCSKLQPLLAKAAQLRDRAFVVNVSAMEGKFYRYKTPNHPHTNMAKASLNMLVRTCGADLAKRLRIYMTAVDTGWINDENPAPKAYRTAQTGFQTPIDEVDAAARILHPVFDGIVCETPLRQGVFLKDHGGDGWWALSNLSQC